ncbi:hypothetical protein QWZ10_22455 [Paracoccus cavernae]|uniref:Uncharacterized protein n=1 Tax=Paracoccus cavernae TaxID=1571207 RepID=A0ABT8DBH9_9RHOB|nr:hypothetical protein [Paracoccus cavernae]MDN3713835.1 hypothetical protein [Paracoccus cavernae]
MPASDKARVVAISSVGNSDRILAREGVTSLADLKGKKVAVPEGLRAICFWALRSRRQG